MLAWRLEKLAACSECGTRKDEYTEDPNAYVAEADRCPGCEKIAWERRSWVEDEASTYGLRFRLVRPEDVSAVRMPETRKPNPSG